MAIDYDKYGYCVKCHKSMITTKVINLEVKTIFTPDRDEIEFILDDNTKMRVAICKTCKAQVTNKDYKDIMRSVHKGWEEETKNLKHWTKEKRDKYLKEYKKRKITKEVKYGSNIKNAHV